ncbi:MAG: hypothetical protein FH761_06935 [Firmicutes bacterium]|nr:hypothetical protein [Bacillota bacterium]
MKSLSNKTHTKFIKGVIILLSVVQILLVVGAIVLKYFSDKSMGVARYLVYKNQVLKNSVFSSELMKIYLGLLIISMMISVVILIKKYKWNKSKIYILESIFLIVINIISILFMYNKLEILTYYFTLIISFIVLILQYIKTVAYNLIVIKS